MNLDSLRKYIHIRKARYAALPVFFKVVVITLASVLFVFGAILTPFLGDVGVPIMIVAMGVLGFEFAWAQRVFEWLLYWVERFLVWFDRLTKLMQWIIIILTVITIGAAMYFFYIHYLG